MSKTRLRACANILGIGPFVLVMVDYVLRERSFATHDPIFAILTACLAAVSLADLLRDRQSRA